MANLFWTHPLGDTTTIPCVHLTAQHPGGDTHTVPCTHYVQQHPGGDPNPVNSHLPNVPCVHVQQQHPNGDTVTTPCVHIVQQHPGGDPGPVIPCLHPLPLVRDVPNLGLRFYTADASIQAEAIAAAQRLRNLGIIIGTPLRPLCIFNRDPINGNPNDATDPFWSHYEPLTHAIQITHRPSPLDVAGMRDTLHHEMGHATIGQNLVQITTPGQPHGLTTPTNPAEAMSEGWAHFIALVIRFDRTATNPTYKGKPWDRRDPAVACRADIEYNVGCMLWDLLDVPDDGVIPGRVGPDTVTLPLSELFRVYSPTLTTILNGPIISSVRDYLARLENNNSALRTRIETVRRLNCC